MVINATEIMKENVLWIVCVRERKRDGERAQCIEITNREGLWVRPKSLKMNLVKFQ